MTRLTVKRLEAIVAALDFLTAGEFDEPTHGQPIGVFEDARDWAADELCRREQRIQDGKAARHAKRAGFA